MATTTNYGWTTPDDTALVKDGASAIRTLGSSVDTTTKALNPSTTLGDIEYRSSSANTNTRLGIGSTGQVLIVAGGVPTWGTVSAGGMTLLETLTLSGSSTTSGTLSTSYKQFFLFIKNAYNSADAQFRIRFNGDSGANYSFGCVENGSPDAQTGQTLIRICNISTTSSGQNSTNAFVSIMIPSQTNEVFVASQAQANTAGLKSFSTTGVYDSSAAITTITFLPNTGTLSGGTVYIYGVN